MDFLIITIIRQRRLNDIHFERYIEKNKLLIYLPHKHWQSEFLEFFNKISEYSYL